MIGISGITVVHNTPELVKRAIESIRKFYHKLPITMINGSTDGYKYRFSEFSCYNLKQNIGHGPGLNFGLERCPTRFALIFDSDIEMIAPCIDRMADLLAREKATYGVGQVVQVDENGRNVEKGIAYLHPHFALIDVTMYFSWHRFTHHGAPCLRAMKELHDAGMSDCLIDFPVSEYVKHEGRGTRNLNPPEFLKDWEK